MAVSYTHLDVYKRQPLRDYGFWSADIPDGWSRRNGDVVSVPYLTQVSKAVVTKGGREMEGKHIGFFTEFITQAGEEVTMKDVYKRQVLGR